VAPSYIHNFIPEKNMKITRAIITAAGRGQRNLPLQTLVDRDGQPKSVLGIILEEVQQAGIDDICIIVHPDDEKTFRAVAGDRSRSLSFVFQQEPRGYGHAVWLAKDFVNGQPFLHLIGDHLYVSRMKKGCAQRVVETAEKESCSISAVQATREGLLHNFGAVGGKRVSGKSDLYSIETVIEKPTPTEAEDRLLVPGLRGGNYLCFFGMHVFTPSLMDILDDELRRSPDMNLATISPALQRLSRSEKYLALQMNDYRYNVGTKYGLLNAQLALALNGQDREEVLGMLMEMLLLRERHITQESKE
jgi:UTP--glucose-1-phosphate uridylyltransferase